jgi:hypothetical protein
MNPMILMNLIKLFNRTWMICNKKSRNGQNGYHIGVLLLRM